MTARAWRIVAALTLLAWCVAMITLRRTPAITDDWQGWRQADTQAIARNFAFEEFSPLRPRIDWRGDGPGYVETELQLYPTLIAIALRVAGESVWPGQLLSLAAVALTAALLFAALARRFGEAPAYLAVVAILGHQGTIAIATSIQPDSISLLLFTIGFLAFVRDLERCASRAAHPKAQGADRALGEPGWRSTALWIAATATAALVKPTTLELGVVEFVLVRIVDRRLLRGARFWIGWGVVLAVVATHLAIARHLYVTYGNTFGVLSGGDSKLPSLSRMASPSLWFELARYEIVWGFGIPAAASALYLAWRRRLEREPIALAVGAIVLCVLALRYTSHRFGTHYHLPHAVLGAWLVAAASAELAPRLRLRAFAHAGFAALVAVAIVLGIRSVRFLRALEREPETILGAKLAELAPPNTLVAVRARAEGYNDEWRTVNNFEDPRVFYLSRTRGWALPNDLAGADRLADLASRGARFYVHVRQKPIDPELATWLAGHAENVDRSEAGEIYRLASTAPSPGDASRTK